MLTKKPPRVREVAPERAFILLQAIGEGSRLIDRDGELYLDINGDVRPIEQDRLDALDAKKLVEYEDAGSDRLVRPSEAGRFWLKKWHDAAAKDEGITGKVIVRSTTVRWK